jgi:hypothetical protein
MSKSECEAIMCKHNINDREDAKKFLLKNHPDKNSDFPKDEFKTILGCYKNKYFCYEKNKEKAQSNAKSTRFTKKDRQKMYTCMRKTANFGKIKTTHKFDKPDFSAVELNKDILDASPKIVQLLNNIKKLDAEDQSNHGKKFKHFIFSDIKEGGYGAKIIASVLTANGYNNIVKARKDPKYKDLQLYLDIPSSNSNFGLLCSNSIYGTTFNEKIKKNLLDTFNSRPANINGNKLRIIVLDSGFKEGIDLFDVKYVHVFEPSMTTADLKQIVGRATRTCGQKGLVFQPGKGWPLYVYNYYLTVPTISQNSLYASNYLTYNITEPKKDEFDKDILVFKDVEKLSDTTKLYSEFDVTMDKLSNQLYELAATFAVDYELTVNIHNVEDLNHELMEKDLYMMGGAKNVYAKTNTKSSYYKIDLIKCNGKCGKKTTKDIPVGINFLKEVYIKYSHPKTDIPKTNQRQFFCDYLTNHKNGDIYCAQLNKEWSERYGYIPGIVEKNKKIDKVKFALEKIDLDAGVDADAGAGNDSSTLDIVEYVGKANQPSGWYPNHKLSFLKMRDFIKSNYNKKEYKWSPMVIENKCVDPTGANAKSTSDVTLNPTQKFVSKFFCPESPYKGLLLWHSVGTGKTCSGVSIASTSFEQAGYSILWVTRTTLKSDIWKNIFDQICHSVIKHEVDNGLIMPDNITARKKLLSRNWLDPMSYMQFSNLLIGKNKNYDKLKSRNGPDDILKKTLVIIDEGHKLYGTDLKHSEKPDTDIMEKMIMNSYKKSKADSCKILIMTATPFTNSPLELFKLTNLFMETEAEKITTEKKEFIKQYMTRDNVLGESGSKNLANKLTGYISYLNREKDASQFAQPIMINVPVLMTTVDSTLREAIFLSKKVDDIDEDVKIQINTLKAQIKKMKAEQKSGNENFAAFKKMVADVPADCKNLTGENKKQCLKRYKDEIEETKYKLRESMDKIHELAAELNELNSNLNELKAVKQTQTNRLKEIKKSLIQEYMLYTRCVNFRYSKPTKKGKSLSLNRPKRQQYTRKFKTI